MRNGMTVGWLLVLATFSLCRCLGLKVFPRTKQDDYYLQPNLTNEASSEVSNCLYDQPEGPDTVSGSNPGPDSGPDFSNGDITISANSNDSNDSTLVEDSDPLEILGSRYGMTDVSDFIFKEWTKESGRPLSDNGDLTSNARKPGRNADSKSEYNEDRPALDAANGSPPYVQKNDQVDQQTDSEITMKPNFLQISAEPVNKEEQVRKDEQARREEQSRKEEQARKEEIKEIVQQLTKFCDGSVPGSEWLQCEDTSGGVFRGNAVTSEGRNLQIQTKKTLRIASGSYGVAIFGWIGLTPGMEVRKNQILRPGTKSATDILVRHPYKIVDLRKGQSLAVVIKVPFKLNNKNTTPPLVIESCRNRNFAYVQFPNGRPAGPAILDVYLYGHIHKIHDIGLVQERIQGMTGERLVRQVFEGDSQSFSDTILHFVRKFDLHMQLRGFDVLKFDSQLKPKTSLTAAKGRLFHRMSSLSFNDRQLLASRTQSALSAAERAQKEAWIRAVLRLRLARLFLDALLQLWLGGAMHCDSHPANVMFVRTRVTTPQDLMAAKGKTIIPGHRLYYSITRRPTPQEEAIFQKYGYVNVYKLNVGYFRYIDAANAIPLTPIINEIARDVNLSPQLRNGPGGVTNSQIAKKMVIPCALYGNRMPEDITQVFRSGPEALLGVKKFTVGALGFSVILREQLTHKLVKLPSPLLQAYVKLWQEHAQLFQTGNSPMQTDPAHEPLLEHWEVFFRFFEKLQATAAAIDRVFALPATLIKNLQGYIDNCHKGRKELPSIPANVPRWKFAISHSWGLDCNYHSMLWHIRNILNNIKKAMLQVPPEYKPYFDD